MLSLLSSRIDADLEAFWSSKVASKWHLQAIGNGMDRPIDLGMHFGAISITKENRTKQPQPTKLPILTVHGYGYLEDAAVLNATGKRECVQRASTAPLQH